MSLHFLYYLQPVVWFRSPPADFAHSQERILDQPEQGSYGQFCPVAMATEIAAEIPGAELAVIDDAGHLSNIEKPGQFNAAVLGFLKRHTGK